MRVLSHRLVTRHLLLDERLRASSKVTYGLLRIHRKNTIAFNATAFNMRYDTLRRNIRQLQELDWAYEFLDPITQRPIVVPWMPLAVEHTLANELRSSRSDTPFWGETLARHWLDTIVDDDDRVDNARPEWLVSGFGGYRKEIDFFFRRAAVAIEFQGRYHFEAGPSEEEQIELQRQQQRDALKSLICVRHNIAFVEITGKDLYYDALLGKLGHLLPIIPPRLERPLFRTLAEMSHSYVNNLNR